MVGYIGNVFTMGNLAYFDSKHRTVEYRYCGSYLQSRNNGYFLRLSLVPLSQCVGYYFDPWDYQCAPILVARAGKDVDRFFIAV